MHEPLLNQAGEEEQAPWLNPALFDEVDLPPEKKELLRQLQQHMAAGHVHLTLVAEELEVETDAAWRRKHPKDYVGVAWIIWDGCHREVLNIIAPLLPRLAV